MKSKSFFFCLLAGLFFLFLEGFDWPVPKSPEWKTYTFKDLRCRLVNPYPFKEMDPGYSDEEKKDVLLTRTMVSQGIEKDFFVSSLTAMHYRNGKPDPEEMGSGCLEGLKELKTYSDFKVNTEPVTVSGLKGVLTAGTAKMFWIKHIRIKALEVTQGHWAWQVLLLYADDDDYETMAQRVVGSVAILKEPKSSKGTRPSQ